MSTTIAAMDEVAEQVLGPNQRVRIVLDETGDKKTVWNADAPDEVEAAHREFDFLKSKGYSAYRVDNKGKRGEVMQKFDTDAEAIIFTPRQVGG